MGAFHEKKIPFFDQKKILQSNLKKTFLIFQKKKQNIKCENMDDFLKSFSKKSEIQKIKGDEEIFKILRRKTNNFHHNLII